MDRPFTTGNSGAQRKAYALWQANHTHPSLRFEKVGRFWWLRVDDGHRALGIEEVGEIIRFFIGPHDR